MDEMKREIGELKDSVARIDASVTRLDSTVNRMAVTVAQLVGGLSDMKDFLAENMATKKDISNLNSRMDGFSGLLLDSRHRWAVHAETLAQHDARLTKIETRDA